MVLGEVHSLKIGDRFAFEASQPATYEVRETGLIDYYGEALVLYSDGTHLFGHIQDHTPVWIFSN